MNKVFSKIFTAVSAASFALITMLAFTPMEAEAQTYGSVSIGSFPASTVNIVGATTTNQSAVIDCRQSRHVNFTLSCGAVSNATTATYYFVRSPDNVIYDDTAYYQFVLSMAANSIGTTNIDVDVGAVGYLKFLKLVTGATYSVTNPSCRVALKPGS